MTAQTATAGALWRRLGAVGYAGALVSIATAASNGLAYLVPVVAARLLPAAELGALAALIAIGSIAAVAGLGLQTALAVRWARHGAIDGATRMAVTTAAVTTGLLLLAIPVCAILLRLEPEQTALLAALTFPIVLGGRWLGELQGRELFGRLAAGLVVQAVARYGGLVVALAAGLGLTSALAVGAAGSWLSLLALALLTPPGSSDGETTPVHGRDVLRAGAATLAMLAVSSADVILARGVLPAEEAGAYSVGAVLAKGALWAPAMVTVLALPRLAAGSRNALRLALACVGVSGIVLMLASLLLNDLAIGLAGGAGYAHLAAYAPAFAAVGALYALVFVFVNAEIANGSRWPSAPLWLTLAGLVAAVELAGVRSVGQLLALSVTAAVTATVATALVYRLRRGHRESTSPVSTASPATD